MTEKTKSVLETQLTETLGRAYCVMCGRGTTALWLALRAIARRDGPGEVIVPDLLCGTALDGVLLAGFTPVFADVVPHRFTLSARRGAYSVAQLVTSRTRAILAAHLFGHVADIALIRDAAPGIPLIEDAVQGFGGAYRGRPVGSLGDLSFVSFDRYKMIGGRGGALLFDDPALLDGIQADLDTLPNPPDLDLDSLDLLLPPPAAAGYAIQLRALAPTLLRRFDPSRANLDRIRAGWDTLAARVEARNTNARHLQTCLSGLPVGLPELRAGDAIWCYTITVPSPALARWLIHGLRSAGLAASDLYPPLSRLVGQPAGAGWAAHRLVNLWADETTSPDVIRRMADVIAAAPWSRVRPG